MRHSQLTLRAKKRFISDGKDFIAPPPGGGNSYKVKKFEVLAVQYPVQLSETIDHSGYLVT